MRVLLTGASGFIGQNLASELTPHHELRLFDVAPSDDPRSVVGDVRDLASVAWAMRGMEAVIHLAIASGHEGDVEDDAFNALRFDVNVKGTYNVLEAARRCSVRRVVYTSSLTLCWGYRPDEFIGPDAEARPVGTYALTKYLGEVMCGQFAKQFDLSIICLRIAKPIDPDDPHDSFARQQEIPPQWIHMRDLCRAFRLAVEAADIDFEVIHLVGESSRRRWDLSRAERVLGYRPQFRLEEMGYRFRES